jgi:TfoX/Sxy family transcriptional regulator of competence genes
MAKQSIAELEEILNIAAKGLPKITSKKMFGCYALWVDGNVFALVWKYGRIGVKLPDAAHYQSLMDASGAEPWKAGPMQMAHWVLVPESFHSKPAEVKKWAAKAHGQCLTLEKKAKKSPPKKAGGKNVATKKVK